MGLRRRGLDGPTFQMREKLIAIGDDFWIEDDDGNRVFKVNGKAARMRDTFILEDASGNELSKIQEKKLSVRDKMTIERGDTKATVHKRLLGIRDHYVIEVDGGDDLKAHGNIVDHEYEIERDGDTVAKCRRSGSGSATPTASSWPRARMSRSSWRSPCASTRWRVAEQAPSVSLGLARHL